jgi:hypothetical protein
VFWQTKQFHRIKNKRYLNVVVGKKQWYSRVILWKTKKQLIH